MLRGKPQGPGLMMQDGEPEGGSSLEGQRLCSLRNQQVTQGMEMKEGRLWQPGESRTRVGH